MADQIAQEGDASPADVFLARTPRPPGRAGGPSKLHYFGHEDPGALVNASAAGVLAIGGNQELAQKFLAYTVGVDGRLMFHPKSSLPL